MAQEKPAAELVALFDRCLPVAPGVERRQMFGCACAFANGNMFAGLYAQTLILRLPADERQALIAEGGAGPFTVMGRTMREYVSIAEAVQIPPARFAALLGRGLAYAASLPAKPVKPRSAAGARRQARSR